MSTFRDTEHLYEVMGALVTAINHEREIADRLLESHLVVRFVCRDPEGVVTVDLTREPITAYFGPSPPELGRTEARPSPPELGRTEGRPSPPELGRTEGGPPEPDVTFSLSGDTAHLFWLGRLNITRAIATRQVVARGSVPKALKLLPAVKPAYAIYPQVLRDLGYADLIPQERGAAEVRRRSLLDRLRTLFRRAPKVEIDYEGLRRRPIPLLEEVLPQEVEFTGQELPTEEGALKAEMLRRMVLIRTFEDRLAEEFHQGDLPSEGLFLSTGQEATAVGACFALRVSDIIATTYRNIAHVLAKGADPQGLAAELFGKETGLCKGKGGVMHAADARVGALPGTGIVGASTLMGIGVALAARQRDSDQVAVCFLGDGATNQGMFHEAVNFAAVLNLPAVFIIENNLYGEFTPLSRATRVQQLSQRAAAYGVPGFTVDGNDAWAVYQATREAVERARSGAGPTLLECMTYRLRGHTEGEDVEYRTTEEVEEWRKKDPIPRLQDELVAQRVLTEADVARFEEKARQVTTRALAFAHQSPEPGADSLTEHVYAPEPARLYQPGPRLSATREISFGQAVTEALAEEMARDERVFLLGEEVSTGGYFAVTADLVKRFGHKRVIDTPISEYAIVGSAVSAAMTGTRPVAEIMFSDFLTCCMDPIVNHAAKMHYLSGGQYRVPLVVRSPGGAGVGLGPQHSQSFEALLTGIPGLIVIAPGTPYDAKGLLKSAVRSNNPVLFFENKLLYATIGPVPEQEYLVPIGVAEVKRAGRDVTLVAVGSMVGPALAAAEALAAGEGIDVEVVDPRTLVPCDWATIVRSVVKTGRLVVVEEGHLTGGFGGEVVARVAEVAWGALKAPVRRAAALDVPIPYNRALENAVVPDATRIREAVVEVMG